VIHLARCKVCDRDNRIEARTIPEAEARMATTMVCHAGMHPFPLGQLQQSGPVREVTRFRYLFRVP
jgi:hypothetical protein